MTSKEKVNVLSSNVFNSTQKNTERLPWRTLSSEKRLDIFNEYLDSIFSKESGKTIDSNTVEMIRGLVVKGKLKLKKEITYDNVNERIIKIHALVPETHTDHYVYKPELLIRREKSKKIAKAVLFRKK